MIIFPYKRLPGHIANNIPDDWSLGRSDSGWMVSSTFYEYVANVLYPWLLDKKRYVYGTDVCYNKPNENKIEINRSETDKNKNMDSDKIASDLDDVSALMLKDETGSLKIDGINNTILKVNKEVEIPSIDDLWRQHLSWPRLQPSTKKKTQQLKIPYAITSKKWKEIQEKKENERLEKEKILKGKREAKMKKKMEKETIAKRKKTTKDTNVTSRKKLKLSIKIDAKSDTENSKENNADNLQDKSENILSADHHVKNNLYNIGNYVIVRYEEAYFPGIVKNLRGSEYEVSVMWLCGTNKWKWPKVDVL